MITKPERIYLLMMTLRTIGMNYRHDGDFEIIRPDGSGENLIVIFKSAAEVVIDGTVTSVLPDSMILYSVGTPQIYRACGESYTNHWIHLDCCEKDDFHLATGLPFNKVMKLTNVVEIEDIMHMMSREILSDMSSKDQYMDLLIRMLLIKLGDSCKASVRTVTNPHYAGLRQLRAEIYSSAGQFSSVEQLAEMVSLSQPHFQRLYKELFGVSSYEDLLCAKIKAAQYYLKNTDMTVKEIAAACGYENDVCFMRRFKQRTDLTPMEYRKSGRGEK